MATSETSTSAFYSNLAEKIKLWSHELGFADIGITDVDLSNYETSFFDWIDQGYHGSMDYMQSHGTKRTRPAELVPGTLRLISVRLNYFDGQASNAIQQLHQPEQAYISRYALGRDYHKVLRKRLQQLADKIQTECPDLQFRAFTDSAPVLEQAIAHKAGLGFIGKNSLVIHPRAGSWFFLGELFVNIPLPVDSETHSQGCGPCTACIQECPTQAILDNNQVDARRCISYLTIEYDGIISEELRSLIGNRIYGCDDCQLVCPWNRFASFTQEAAFHSRKPLDDVSLLNLFALSEQQFLSMFEGSPIRRIGYAKWTRNISISLGNLADAENTPLAELKAAYQMVSNKMGTLTPMVDEHLLWAKTKLQSAINTYQSTARHVLQRIPVQVHTTKPFIAKKYHYPTNRKKSL